MTIFNLTYSTFRAFTFFSGLFIFVLSFQLQAANRVSFEVEVKGHGQSIILIPGLMSDASVYEGLADDLSQNYKVHLLSVKGFASTPAGASFSLTSLVQDIINYIDNNKLQRPHIIGHSMGGLTGFILASYHQDKIGKLVSIDGLPFIGPIFTRTNTTTVDMMKPQAQGLKAMFANMNSQQLAAQTQQGVFIQATTVQDQDKIVDMAKQSDPITVGNAMFAVMTTDMREPLTHSNTHILMLGASGGFSQQAQHEQASVLYKQQFENVKNAEVVMNTQLRHFMFFDDAKWVSQRISQFLGRK